MEIKNKGHPPAKQVLSSDVLEKIRAIKARDLRRTANAIMDSKIKEIKKAALAQTEERKKQQIKKEEELSAATVSEIIKEAPLPTPPRPEILPSVELAEDKIPGGKEAEIEGETKGSQPPLEIANEVVTTPPQSIPAEELKPIVPEETVQQQEKIVEKVQPESGEEQRLVSTEKEEKPVAPSIVEKSNELQLTDARPSFFERLKLRFKRKDTLEDVVIETKEKKKITTPLSTFLEKASSLIGTNRLWQFHNSFFEELEYVHFIEKAKARTISCSIALGIDKTPFEDALEDIDVPIAIRRAAMKELDLDVEGKGRPLEVLADALNKTPIVFKRMKPLLLQCIKEEILIADGFYPNTRDRAISCLKIYFPDDVRLDSLGKAKSEERFIKGVKAL